MELGQIDSVAFGPGIDLQKYSNHRISSAWVPNWYQKHVHFPMLEYKIPRKYLRIALRQKDYKVIDNWWADYGKPSERNFMACQLFMSEILTARNEYEMAIIADTFGNRHNLGKDTVRIPTFRDKPGSEFYLLNRRQRVCKRYGGWGIFEVTKGQPDKWLNNRWFRTFEDACNALRLLRFDRKVFYQLRPYTGTGFFKEW